MFARRQVFYFSLLEPPPPHSEEKEIYPNPGPKDGKRWGWLAVQGEVEREIERGKTRTPRRHTSAPTTTTELMRTAEGRLRN